MPVRDGQGAAREPGAGTARDERQALARADADEALHLGRRAGKGDELRHRPPAGEAVAVVDAQLLRLGDRLAVADDGADLGEDGRGEAHFASLLSASRPDRSIIDYRGFCFPAPVPEG